MTFHGVYCKELNQDLVHDSNSLKKSQISSLKTQKIEILINNLSKRIIYKKSVGTMALENADIL